MSLEALEGAGGVDYAGLAVWPNLLQCPSQFLEMLPIAVYACDAEGRILWFNGRAADLWGRRPRIGDDSERYCGSYKLFFDGRPIRKDETPMAQVLKTGLPVKHAEALVERPDGTAVWAAVHIEPVKDERGQVIGAINCFHDVTTRAAPPAYVAELIDVF